MLPDDMSGSRLYGVELDSITGRIARQLYPDARITISGFEKTQRRDFFDLAIGNVPFGGYKVSDKQFDKYNFMIHDYFFAKTLEQVRPGGARFFLFLLPDCGLGKDTQCGCDGCFSAFE